MIIGKLFFKHNLLKMPFYAVAKGRNVGIYSNWYILHPSINSNSNLNHTLSKIFIPFFRTDCERQVSGFQGPRFKKFNTRVQAEEFIINNANPSVVLQQLHYSSSDDSDSDLVVDLTSTYSPGSMGHQLKNIVSILSMPEIDLSTAESNPELAEALQRIEKLKRQLDDLKQENEHAATSSTAPKRPKRAADTVNVPVKVGKYSYTQDTDGYVHVSSW
jgi:hypothetical protein